ncbi:Acyl-coenzyme A thioesterase PaaI, contains HGG motif [Amycolatopsis tolypomycina]|uniref:Acyl-coenzyme A thioesterase THEM4 n=1 Tax=Amycolatopsis tolypomycina TaxID=208445 RepID=A0A1H5ATD7_9PSEU|nr:PaaI family thioesterase [Amycolatopsis tolypomycina]SED44880.1 Acyl-coenzyme A thioesterase PaaI, contains HGG motif [Amycolatopsis tolypomycina]
MSENPFPVVDGVPPGRALLGARIRELIEAAVCVRDDEADLAAAARRVEAVTEALRAGGHRSPLLLAALDGGGHLSINNPLEGPGNPLAPPLSWAHIGPESVRADVLLGAAHEGPPGRVHGGWVAAVLDHVLGRATAAAGFPGMTASLTVDYHHGTPYAVPLTAEGRLVRRDGRKLHATGELKAGDVVCATATAILVHFSADQFPVATRAMPSTVD